MPELTFGNVTLVVATGRMQSGGREIRLAPRERSLLEMLMRHAGLVVQKRRIEQAFSEFGDERTANAVELAVSRVRKKLEDAKADLAIETVRGVGYMLREKP
jgi:two-component system response regulator QseB/two-component system response regulator TctD